MPQKICITIKIPEALRDKAHAAGVNMSAMCRTALEKELNPEVQH